MVGVVGSSPIAPTNSRNACGPGGFPGFHGSSRELVIQPAAPWPLRLLRRRLEPNLIRISLPDGSVREYPAPLTVAEVAASIGAGLAKAALAGKVDGELVDTSHRIDADATLAIVTDKDADGLEVIRHS
ncbi:MAG: hypothetical protein RLZ51_401, partial [Pseudomonadota bacterium]